MEALEEQKAEDTPIRVKLGIVLVDWLNDKVITVWEIGLGMISAHVLLHGLGGNARWPFPFLF